MIEEKDKNSSQFEPEFDPEFGPEFESDYEMVQEAKKATQGPSVKKRGRPKLSLEEKVARKMEGRIGGGPRNLTPEEKAAREEHLAEERRQARDPRRYGGFKHKAPDPGTKLSPGNPDFPPPIDQPLFVQFWNEGINNLVSRPNFKLSHLRLYETLCMLLVERRVLDDFVMEFGHIGFYNGAPMVHAEVKERHHVISAIGTYSRLLDMLPKKDNGKKDPSLLQEDEWA